MCYSRLMFFIFILLSFSFSFFAFFLWLVCLRRLLSYRNEKSFFVCMPLLFGRTAVPFYRFCCPERFGGLVLLDFAVAGFASATYLRRRLRRPSWKSYLGVDFALRCFQRLFLPDSATLPCYWRNNRCTGGRSDTVLSY